MKYLLALLLIAFVALNVLASHNLRQANEEMSHALGVCGYVMVFQKHKDDGQVAVFTEDGLSLLKDMKMLCAPYTIYDDSR